MVCSEKGDVRCQESLLPERELDLSVGQRLQIPGARDKFNHRQLFWASTMF